MCSPLISNNLLWDQQLNVGSVHEEERDAHLNKKKHILYLYKKQIQREDTEHKSLVGLNCRHFYDLYLDGSVVILALLLHLYDCAYQPRIGRLVMLTKIMLRNISTVHSLCTQFCKPDY